MLDPRRQATVILELDGEPVASVEAAAAAAGRALSPVERTALRTELRAHQDALAPRLTTLGARVLGQYQDAYNGMKVRVALRDLERLRRLPGVTDILAVPRHTLADATSDAYVGAVAAWSAGTGFTGRGVKIAIIDSGIDYYHATFGGSGSSADFAADDGLTGGTDAFPGRKVAGGFDFVGDDYDPTLYGAEPRPDPDPLDCVGHGTAVAAAAAGYGVTSDGKIYRGPYDASALAKNDFLVAPGVAPGADLYALRVFGCEGPSDVVLDAIDWAVKNRMDVINLSLGSPFGGPESPDLVAVDNAARAGIVVVAAAGNDGPVAYTVSAPASASRALAVAAVDAVATLPTARIDLGGITAIDLNEAAPFSVSGPLVVLSDGAAGIGLGCGAAEYDAVERGAIVLTRRGSCPGVDRAILGQKAGAAAVIMVNSAPAGTYPPLEGSIPGVTIPFLGVTRSDGRTLQFANGQSVTIASDGSLPNPAYARVADFSSGGPRDLDGLLKPDIAAPGVAMSSAAMGTGNGRATYSGTSLAAPLVAGVAALVRQAHPGWTVEQVKAAIMSTGASTRIKSYDPRLDGSGLVQAQRAVDTVVVATTGAGTASLSFGTRDLAGPVSLSRTITLANTGASSVGYRLTSRFVGRSWGARVTISPSAVTVPARGSATVTVTLRMSGAAVASLPDGESPSDARALLTTVRGAIVAAPVTRRAGVYVLRVPFLLAPRSRSSVVAPATVALAAEPSGGRARGSVVVTNSGVHRGTADVYAWGIRSPDTGIGSMDLRAAGVQSLRSGLDGRALPSDERLLVFAINTYRPWGSPAVNEFDIEILAGDSYFLIGVLDHGLVRDGSPDGRLGCFVMRFEDQVILDAVFAKAAPNGTTLRCAVLASTLGIREAGRALEYAVGAASLVQPLTDPARSSALFDPFASSISQGDRIALRPGGRAKLALWVDPVAFKSTPALGWMIVSPDDPSGPAQADTLPVVLPAPGPSESPAPGPSESPAPGPSESPAPGPSESPAPGPSESPAPGP
jgi:subtilisin family serine protease